MDEMAKHKNKHDLMEEIEDPFLDDPEAETSEEDEISAEAAEADETAALRSEVADLKDRLCARWRTSRTSANAPSATGEMRRSTAPLGLRATSCRCTTISTGRWGTSRRQFGLRRRG